MDGNNESYLYPITTDNMMMIRWQEGQRAEMQIINKMLNEETSNLPKKPVFLGAIQNTIVKNACCKTKQKVRNNIIRKIAQTRKKRKQKIDLRVCYGSLGSQHQYQSAIPEMDHRRFAQRILRDFCSTIRKRNLSPGWTSTSWVSYAPQAKPSWCMNSRAACSMLHRRNALLSQRHSN